MQEKLQDAAGQVKKNPVSELQYALEDIDLLIAYLAKTGKEVPEELIRRLIELKHAGGIDKWTPEQEGDFWLIFREITRLIKPVTMGSLKAFAVNLDYAYAINKKYKKGRLQKTIFRYGMSAFAVVFVIIVLQTYHFVGQDVLEKSKELFVQRNDVREAIERKEVAARKLQDGAGLGRNVSQILKNDEDYQLLLTREKTLDQEFDANRTLLFQWNSIWRLGRGVEPQFSYYDKYRYDTELERLGRVKKNQQEQLRDAAGTSRDNLQRALDETDQQLEDLGLEVELHRSRDVFFRSRLSATFVLNLLHTYLLPLLYGCLGSFSLVLRNICRLIKEETFSSSFSLDHNMRIILGSVSGMAAGLFLGDNALLDEGGFSLMLVAFVIGYNVEVLFSMVDNVASRMTSKMPGDNATETVSKKK